MDTDPFDIQQPVPETGQLSFDISAGSFVRRPGDDPLSVRRWERSTVNLPARGHRQCVHHHKCRRHHVVWKLLCQRVPPTILGGRCD